ncbi:MAG: ATP-dependent zinc metalloprotease FtsH [Candidatus Methylomirabilales bacterium]
MQQLPKQLWANPMVRLLLFLAATGLIYGLFFSSQPVRTRPEIPYSRFKEEVRRDRVKAIVIQGERIRGNFTGEVTVGTKEGPRTVMQFETVRPPIADPELSALLEGKGIQVTAEPVSEVTWLGTALGTVLPLLLIFGIWWYMAARMQQRATGLFDIGKSKPRITAEDAPKVTFADVAGLEAVKQDLKEVIEFLRFPDRFRQLGAKIPKGILLMGPPGTGKTLLARAVAGEAGVPFFSITGPEFVEMFVGVGAARVRDLFLRARQKSPCIVFIDEIDAVGRTRGAGLGGGHDEREQTLNQLLAEMDGFSPTEGIILMAATNRPDVLDPALLRPGRFDRRIVVDRLERGGRLEVLKVHARDKPLNTDVDLEWIARGTPGFSGADLANLVNEAALLAARREKSDVGMAEFEEARDKILMGAERRDLINERERKTIAYHEAGHALVAYLLPGADPLHKVSIIPRGMSLGVTQLLPLEERRNYPRSYLLDRITIMLGGRGAERVVLGELTSGAQDDIRQVTELARRMVCQWGMSEKLGPLSVSVREEHVFLGRELTRAQEFSEETAALIDQEVKGIVESCAGRAEALLKENLAKLHALTAALLEEESLNERRLAEVVEAAG